MTNNTKRFSDRADDYAKYRPHYPDCLVQTLEAVIPINPSTIIADIGSGTGLSSIPFLERGYTVLGVEPNAEMRAAAEQSLSGYQKFRSVNGTAEQTTLSDNSVDLIFSGQAFHWFDKEKSKIECNRILSAGGNMVIAWNVRDTSSQFQQAYEQMLYDHLEGYKRFSESKIDETLMAQFFSPKPLHQISLENNQTLDYTGLVGRLRSSSYFPKSGAKHEVILNELQRLFDEYQSENTITFAYETKIYWC